MRHFITFSALAPLALANTNLPFFWPGGGEVNSTNPVASIVSVDKATTVVNLACPKSVDLNDCGWGTGQITFSVISTSTYVAAFPQGNFKCTSSKDANVACAMGLLMESADGKSGTMFADTTLSGSDAAMQTATVTAGEEKLAASNTPTATSASGSGSMVTSASAGAKASGSAASATGSAATPTASGAATRFGVEGAALAAMVGAAAFAL
ncbi:hypothetical protein CC80DRAFT_533001 [Byssothecium circinans]|uniref:GPI anchored cell wall protein n=1 Tax=Byssothecium circinans TaxID=147558 RepID=A0A6A5U413_9PLEO|nr:hypothetical protein CC80DRAFT_533001 [Byssothecium circinans]